MCIWGLSKTLVCLDHDSSETWFRYVNKDIPRVIDWYIPVSVRFNK